MSSSIRYYWLNIQMKKRFLLTHGRTFIALDLARLLHIAGHEVMIADSHSLHFTRFSNTVKKSFKVPAPRFDPKGFINKLVSIVKEENIDILIPTFEEVLTISSSLAAFPKKCQVFAEPLEKLMPLHSIWLFNQKLKAYGFPTPESYSATTRDALENIPLKRPYILKPSFSRQAQNIFFIEENKPLPPLTFEQNNPWVAQEFLTGKKYCTYSIAVNGKLLAHSVYPADETAEGNYCVLFRPIQHEKIQNWVEKFIKLENFTGQIAFDFIDNGNLHAIECNPRATNGLLLFTEQDQLERAFLNQTNTLITPSTKKGKQIAGAMLLYGWRHIGFKKYCKSLFSYSDVVFSIRDLKPFLSIPLIYLYYMKKCYKQKLSLAYLYTHDIDWNGEPTNS